MHRFAKSYSHLMHTFPLYVDRLNSTTDSSISAVSLYMKSISRSVKDQNVLLCAEELESNRFRWLSKVVYYTANALKALAVANFNLSTLAITGLTKLVPRDSQENSAKFVSEQTDDHLLLDIKAEINVNKWKTLIAVTEIVSSSLGQKETRISSPAERKERLFPLSPGSVGNTPVSTSKDFFPSSPVESDCSSPRNGFPIAPSNDPMDRFLLHFLIVNYWISIAPILLLVLENGLFIILLILLLFIIIIIIIIIIAVLFSFNIG